MKQAIGKHMAAFRDRRKVEFRPRRGRPPRDVHRHGFDGADIIARVRRNDAFLAGDQRDLRRSLEANDLVENLPGQQAQGQADHAGTVPQHAFDGEMGFARVGRAEDGRHLLLEHGRRMAIKAIRMVVFSHDQVHGWECGGGAKDGVARPKTAARYGLWIRRKCMRTGSVRTKRARITIYKIHRHSFTHNISL